eukprot:c421_g1_i2 orf=331-576(-)
MSKKKFEDSLSENPAITKALPTHNFGTLVLFDISKQILPHTKTSPSCDNKGTTPPQYAGSPTPASKTAIIWANNISLFALM